MKFNKTSVSTTCQAIGFTLFALGIIFWVSLHLNNPDMTETRLLLNYTGQYISTVFSYCLGKGFIKEGIKIGKE